LLKFGHKISTHVTIFDEYISQDKIKPLKQEALSINIKICNLYSGTSSLYFDISNHSKDDALKPSDNEDYIFICTAILRENIMRFKQLVLNSRLNNEIRLNKSSA
jgi:hypothetical protein